MRKLLMAGATALTLVAGSATNVTPASAQGMHMHGGDRGDRGFRGDDRGFRGDDRGFRGERDGGEDLAFGLFGFGLGAALASDRGYYGYDYGPGYGYGPGYDYGTCYSRRWVWDPYVGHYVIERVRYAC
jgi:hypothetical protein